MVRLFPLKVKRTSRNFLWPRFLRWSERLEFMSAARLVNHSKFIDFIKIHKGPKTCGWAYGELFAIFNDIIIIKVVYIKDEKKKS